MKTLNDQSTNKVTIVGKLLDATFNSGKTKAGDRASHYHVCVTHFFAPCFKSIVPLNAVSAS